MRDSLDRASCSRDAPDERLGRQAGGATRPAAGDCKYCWAAPAVFLCKIFGVGCGRYAGGAAGGVFGGGVLTALRCKTGGCASGLYTGGAAGLLTLGMPTGFFDWATTGLDCCASPIRGADSCCNPFASGDPLFGGLMAITSCGVIQVRRETAPPHDPSESAARGANRGGCFVNPHPVRTASVCARP